MDPERSLSIDHVTRAMDDTRQSIAETIDELRDRVHESADWRHQAGAHPVVALLVATASGMVLARILVPAMRLVGLPLLLGMLRSGRSAGPSGLAAILAGLSTAAGVASRLSSLSAQVSRFRKRAVSPEPVVFRKPVSRFSQK